VLRRLTKFACNTMLDAIEHPRQHGLAGLPDDPEDCSSDDEANDGVGEGVSHPHAESAEDDRQTCKPIGPGVVAIGYERRAVVCRS
jgi:hypothetical protein